MSEFLEKPCCCCSIKTGGYFLGVFQFLSLILSIALGRETDENLKLGLDFIGYGKHTKISNDGNFLFKFNLQASL